MATIKITGSNFESNVLQSTIPILVDFWADWCMPCKVVAPILEEIAAEYDGQLNVGKLDVDSEAELATRYNVVSIPTLLLFHQGKVVKQHVGAAPRAKIEEIFKDII